MTPTVQRQKWVEQLTNLNATPEDAQKREEILGGAAATLEKEGEDIKKGLTFDMEVLADTSFTKFMQSIGLSDSKMKSRSGDGNFAKEIDTHHDLPKLKAMSGADVVKAVEALEKVAAVSNKARADLLAVRLKEAGYPAEQAKVLQAALESRKNDKEKSAPKDGEPTKEQLDKFEKDSGRIEQEVDETVAEEVWTPLVRQGLMPENLVPDRFSNVKKTFTAAAAAYQERLEEYSKGLDDNADLLAKLGVGKEVAKQCSDLVKSIAKTIPNAESITKPLETAAELFG